MMRRLLISVSCGFLSVALLLASVLALEKFFKGGRHGETPPLLRAGFWLLGWPLPLFGRIFPAPEGGALKYSMESLVLAILCDVVLATLVIYFVLQRRWRKTRARHG